MGTFIFKKNEKNIKKRCGLLKPEPSSNDDAFFQETVLFIKRREVTRNDPLKPAWCGYCWRIASYDWAV